MARVLLVVPCYNEAERLDGAAFRAFAIPGHELQVLFVDDGSTDDTARVLAELEASDPRLRALSLPQNGGKAEAVRQGVLAALGGAYGPVDHVGYWDADLATPLEELPRFVAVLEEQPAVTMVFGARVKLLGRTIERRTYRHLYGRAFATAVSTMLRLPIYDTQCGAKLLRAGAPGSTARADLQAVFATPFLSRWIFDVEILARYIGRLEERGEEIGERIVEVPLRRWEHVAGSKIGPAAGLRAGWELARIRAHHRAALQRRARRRRGR